MSDWRKALVAWAEGQEGEFTLDDALGVVAPSINKQGAFRLAGVELRAAGFEPFARSVDRKRTKMWRMAGTNSERDAIVEWAKKQKHPFSTKEVISGAGMVGTSIGVFTRATNVLKSVGYTSTETSAGGNYNKVWVKGAESAESWTSRLLCWAEKQIDPFTIASALNEIGIEYSDLSRKRAGGALRAGGYSRRDRVTGGVVDIIWSRQHRDDTIADAISGWVKGAPDFFSMHEAIAGAGLAGEFDSNDKSVQVLASKALRLAGYVKTHRMTNGIGVNGWTKAALKPSRLKTRIADLEAELAKTKAELEAFQSFYHLAPEHQALLEFIESKNLTLDAVKRLVAAEEDRRRVPDEELPF